MKIFLAIAFLATLIVATFGAVAPAAASCTCSRQPNGTYWCTCVDNAGSRYCLSCRNSNTNSCSRVNC